VMPLNLLWQHDQLADGVERLARASGLLRGTSQRTSSSAALAFGSTQDSTVRLNAISSQFGLEVESVSVAYGEIESMLVTAAPAILEVRQNDGHGYLLLCGASRARIKALCPDGRTQWLSREYLRQLVCHRLESPVQDDVDVLLTEAGLQGRQHQRARRAVLQRQLAHQSFDQCWLLRLPPTAHFGRQLHYGGIFRKLASVLSLHALQQTLFMLAWLLIGRAILQDRVDIGYFLGWLLLMASLIPIRLIEGWRQAQVVYHAAALLKQRLLSGVLRFDPNRLRQEGAGRLLAQVIESSAVENVLLTGGVLTILSCVEILAAAVTLLWAPRPYLFLLLLAIWIVLTGLGTWRYIRDRRCWTASRLNMTEDLVEKLVAQRTRIAQERPGQWHDGEDEQLHNYTHYSLRMDQAAVGMSLLARGWLIAGLAALGLGMTGPDVSLGQVAVGLGGILMGTQALTRFNAGLGNLTTAFIAGRRILPLFQAGGTVEPAGSSTIPESDTQRGAAENQPVLQVQDLSYAYPGRTNHVLNGCELNVAPDDRLLIEGPSGSGKSTLAKILAGILSPDNGLMLLGGLDTFTAGPHHWRREISYVPQHHENHIVTGSLAFNLLLGRGWPPTPDDLREAEAICDQLGLNALIRRMPAGLMQIVGETGWQLSHGEKSRVCLARSLLVNPKVVVADESLAALDSTTTRQCLGALVNRKGALVLIAHA